MENYKKIADMTIKRPSAETFQKEIKDEIGIKYLLNCITFKSDFNDVDIEYEMIALTIEGDMLTINIIPYHKTIDELEKMCDNLWQKNNFAYLSKIRKEA